MGEFTLELDASYQSGYLVLDFTIGTPEPVTWATYLILTYPSVQIIPLWSVSLPVTYLPTDIPVSFPLTSAGWAGIYSILYSEVELEAVKLAWVDTG